MNDAATRRAKWDLELDSDCPEQDRILFERDELLDAMESAYREGVAAASMRAEKMAATLDIAHVALMVVIAQEQTGHDDDTYRIVREASEAVGAELIADRVQPNDRSAG
jgi:hypothetical protein